MKNDDLTDFKQQCERSLQRSVEERMHYGFCYVHTPVMDDAPWRSFESTAAYRKWLRENLPAHLGYGDANPLQKGILAAESPLTFFEKVYGSAGQISLNESEQESK
jgi:hypothetical protein